MTHNIHDTFVHDLSLDSEALDTYKDLINYHYEYGGIPILYFAVDTTYVQNHADDLYGEMEGDRKIQYKLPLNLKCRTENYDLQDALRRYGFETEETFTIIMQKEDFDSKGFDPSIGDNIELPFKFNDNDDKGVRMRVVGSTPRSLFAFPSNFLEYNLFVEVERFKK